VTRKPYASSHANTQLLSDKGCASTSDLLPEEGPFFDHPDKFLIFPRNHELRLANEGLSRATIGNTYLSADGKKYRAFLNNQEK